MKHDNEGIIDLDTGKFHQFISKNRVVLVDFWAPWCMPCLIQGKMLKSKLKALPKGARIAKVNVDSNPKIANEYKVKGIPQMYLIVDGKPVKGWTGLTPAGVLFSKMKEHL